MSLFLESISQYKTLVPFYKLVHIIDFDNIFCKSGKEKRRINAIKTIYNNRKNLKSSYIKNIEVINELLEYMRSNSSSENHQNNNLKVVIAFSNFFYISSIERSPLSSCITSST